MHSPAVQGQEPPECMHVCLNVPEQEREKKMTLPSTISGSVYRYVWVCIHTHQGFTIQVKNPDVSIATAPNPQTTSVLSKRLILEAWKRELPPASARCNEFKAPLRPEAADGKQLLPAVFRRAQTKPLCVRNNSYSWAEQSETSIHKLVPLHPFEHSSGSQQEQQRMPALGTALRKNIHLNRSFNLVLSLKKLYFEGNIR